MDSPIGNSTAPFLSSVKGVLRLRGQRKLHRRGDRVPIWTVLFSHHINRSNFMKPQTFGLSAEHRAAVYIQNLTIDMARPFGAKKHNRPSDIFRTGNATHRYAFFQRLAKAG